MTNTKKKSIADEAVLFHPSPIGLLRIAATGGKITTLSLSCLKEEDRPDMTVTRCARQLDEYFAGERQTFDVPLQLSGTPFQLKIWECLQKMPYGETCSYKDLAGIAGYHRACRAVGSANGANPVCIIIPCHRIIAHDGSLGGYAYGLNIKKQLLQLEKMHRIEADNELF